MSTVNAKLTNGVSFGLKRTITAADVSDQVILIDFGVDYPLSSSLLITDDNDIVVSDSGTIKVTYPANGQIQIEDVSETTAEAEVTDVTSVANTENAAVAEISDFTTAANTTGSLNGKYFLISSPTVDYYVWFSTNGTGVDPAVASRTGINVDLQAGDSTDAEVATAIETVLDAFGAGAVFTVDVSTADVTITNQVAGAATDGTAGDSGFTGFTVTQDGADLYNDLDGKYFLISSPTVNYYVWFSTNGTGTDPAVASRTGINVDLASGTSADTVVAAAVDAALVAVGAGAVFSVDTTGAVSTVTNVVLGAATDATAGDSGFTVNITNQGVDESNDTINFVADGTLVVVAQRANEY